MRKLSIVVIIAFCLSFVPARYADEGMWTFDNPPLKQWEEKYGFKPTQTWLDHVRLSVVRLSEGVGGGTGSFVSPDGLVFTNQHVGAGQVAKLSTGGRDLVKEGFYARTREEELKCPDLEVNVMVSYEDVTKRVQGAVKPGASDKEAAAQRRAATAAIEKEESAKTGLKCEVVTLYNGGEYWLYRFKRYTDVRLVFSPEEQIAYFGGDYDNFTFPRYDLDITFFRVYENNQPAKVEHYLKWASPASGEAVSEGELVIVPGFPGSTARLLTAAQIRYHRDVGNPLQMQIWTSRSAALKKYSERGAEHGRQASQTIRSLENSIKRLVGQQAGLENPRIFKKKEDEDAALRKAVASKPEWQRAYGDAWAQIEKAYATLPAVSKRIAFSNLTASRLGTIASSSVRYAEEIRKPNDQRYEEFRDNRIEALKRNLLSPAPIYPEMEEAILAAWLEEAKKTLGADDPFIRAAIANSTPAEAVKRVIAGSKLHDLAFRKTLFESGADAISKSNDPLVELARKVEPIIRELRAWNEEKIQSVETSAGAKIANARFAVYGKSVYPDANFNLRIEYGTVAGYEEDTTLVPFKTTFFGLYDRANSFNEKPPYHLPPRWKDAKTLIDLSTPLNFVYSADTIGGNSGSPVINRHAEIVGINFDSNIQKLPNRYLYIDEREGARAIGVHAAATIEALQKLYGAGKLVEEIKAQKQSGKDHWPSFRGHHAAGVADGQNLPEAWDGEKGTAIKWKAAIPGLAHSSPIVWDDRVFVTTAISSRGAAKFKPGLYGDGAASDDRSIHQWKVYCLDKKTGKIVWEQKAHEGVPADKRHIKSTYASPTPATDGRYVVAFFGSQGLYAFDMKGRLVWKKDLGRMDMGAYDVPDYEWGPASSPIIYKDLVIVQVDQQKGSFLIAVNIKNGETIWKTERDELPSWGTPTIYPGGGPGKDRVELITNASNFIRGYDPETGKELWRLGGSSKITAPTPIFANDLIVVASGRRPERPIFVIRAGASGEITLKDGETSNKSVVWAKRGVGSYMPTPLIYQGLLYVLRNEGILSCYDLASGEEKYTERIPHQGSGFSGSPVAADGKIYLPSEDGDIFVVKAGAKFELLGKNSVGQLLMATPAISGGMMFVRAERDLFAIGR